MACCGKKAAQTVLAVASTVIEQSWESVEVASARADVCRTCPLNILPDSAPRKRGRPRKLLEAITETITETAASAIASTVPPELYNAIPNPQELGKCGACGCDLKAKVYFQAKAIKRTVDQKEELHPYWLTQEEPSGTTLHRSCWIRNIMLQ